MKKWKKIVMAFAAVVIGFIILTASGEQEVNRNPRAAGLKMQTETMLNVMAAVPVPVLMTAQERKMVVRRAQRFDVENKLGYVYIITESGAIIGYYTIFGKVASLRSYLTPVDQVIVPASTDGGGVVVEAPDIDGTYGENVEGVFFFTDNDVYVEWNGKYLYSDQILPIRTIKLNVKTI